MQFFISSFLFAVLFKIGLYMNTHNSYLILDMLLIIVFEKALNDTFR